MSESDSTRDNNGRFTVGHKGIGGRPVVYENESLKGHRLRQRYGISLDDYNALFNKQGGRCAVCGRHQSVLKNTLSVDHNHETGEVRGLLCYQCNAVFVRVLDDLDRLKAAADYVGLELRVKPK